MTNDLHPGTRVRFTVYGKRGTYLGTLNGLSDHGPGFGMLANVRGDQTGNVYSVPLSRVEAI